MLTIKKISDHRLNIELSGKLESSDMEAALEDFIQKSTNITEGKILYIFTDFHLPSLGAFFVKFSRLPTLFSLLKNFQKIAILTDKTWLQNASEIEGKLLKGIEIKAFNLEEKSLAETWLQE